jgi:hypothetical protein
VTFQECLHNFSEININRFVPIRFKEHEMEGGACSMFETNEKYIQIFVQKI